MESLHSDRLRLEPLAPGHIENLYAIYQEPAVRRHLITCPRDRSEFQAIFQHALSFANTHGMWALFTPHADAFVGRVGFFEFSEAARPELAFLLSSRFWGQGFATEACRAALSWAFPRHSWFECVALVRPANDAAGRVCSKLGMRREGSIHVLGAPADVYQVEREVFEEQAV